jgi:hypothetical protein
MGGVMKYSFDKVLDGISRWMDAEILPNMNDWQELIARISVGRVLGNSNEIKKILMGNGYVRTFGIIDSEGMIDVDELISEIKKEMERKGHIVVSIPMFGKLTFVPGDVDTLCRYIKGA